MKKVYWLSVLCMLALVSCKKDSGYKKPDNLLFAKRGDTPGIYDQQGRYVILRGVNYNALGDYWQGNATVATTKQFEENDLKLMAQHGVNCIRLLFSWSRLEPERGTYDQAYIDRLKQVIEIAAKYGIYVLLDMHQDAWGKYVVTPSTVTCDKPNRGWDGAPQWATITDGASTCTTDGSRESAPAVVHCWQNFWNNTAGIQDACVQAWKALAKQTALYTNVVGYDIINEPSLGYQPINTEADKLGKFYRKVTNALRQAEQETRAYQHIIFFEMSVTWNGQPIPFVASTDLITDENTVFAPHHYFESISYLLTIEQGLDLLYGLSSTYKTATFIGEYGYFGNPADDVEKYKRFAKREDANFTSSTWWQWAQAPGDPHGISWDGTQYATTSMALIELDVQGNYTGNKNEYYLNVLSRTRPLAIFGKPTRLSSDPDNGNMLLEAKSTTQGITTLWIPDRFGEPVITGDHVVEVSLAKVDGGYKAAVTVQGNYSIRVGF